jgi:hypothetical protein
MGMIRLAERRAASWATAHGLATGTSSGSCFGLKSSCPDVGPLACHTTDMGGSDFARRIAMGTFGYSSEGRGVEYKALGWLTGNELIGAMRTFASRLEEKPIVFSFGDFGNITAVDVMDRHHREMASICIDAARRLPTTRVIAIHAAEDASFEMARKWQKSVAETRWKIAIFRERSQAVAWLKERVSETFNFEVSLE